MSWNDKDSVVDLIQEFTNRSMTDNDLSTSTWFLKDPLGTTDVW